MAELADILLSEAKCAAVNFVSYVINLILDSAAILWHLERISQTDKELR